MRSPETYFNIGGKRWRLPLAALVVVAAMSCLFNPVAAETFPTDNTRIVQIIIYDNTTQPSYRIIAEYGSDREIQYTIIGDIIGRLFVGVNVGLEHVPEIEDANQKTRVHVQIADENILFEGFLEWSSTGGWGDSWRVVFRGENLNIVLVSSITITTRYELYTTLWENVETWINYLEVGEVLPTPGVPDKVPSTWYPVMLSFAVIIGMSFIGLNLSQPRDPMPGVFMMFVGIVLSWSMGWLPTWIFVTAIALLSLVSAALWGKLFRGR